MKSQNPFILSARFVVKDIVGNFLYWPFWWYSSGLAGLIKRRFIALKLFESNIGLAVWVKNWTKPMYGQYDITGKIISFVIRTFFILFKVVLIILYFILQLAMITFWIGIPIFVIFQLMINISS
ncbi:MAG: hypothetical protein WC310_04835 [Patescibacteria group bacterium]|jgi:hypothetical protein